jgi:hypothetical protein
MGPVQSNGAKGCAQGRIGMIRFPIFASNRFSIHFKREAPALKDSLPPVRGKTGTALGLALALTLAASGLAHAQQDYVPPLSGAVQTAWQTQGEYFGPIDGGGGNLGAWLIANGNNSYTVIFLPGGLLTIPIHRDQGVQDYGGWVRTGWSRSNFLGTATLNGTTFATTTPNGYKTTEIKTAGDAHTITGTTPTGATFTLKKIVRVSATHGRKPLAAWKAKVWFDSATAQADLTKWTNKDNAVSLSRTYYLYRGIQTKDTHGAGLLHIEFQGCFNPTATGQGRSNSGIYLQSHYESQVLDSFGTSAAIDDYGAVYSVKPPSVNAALPPLTWHTYDIYFTPRTSGNAGDAAGAATMTIYANGVKTQDKTAVPGVTTAGVAGNLLAPGPLYLQNHGNEVVYNNIWFIPDATEQSLPYESLLDTAVTSIDAYQLKPLPNGGAINILGLRGDFDLSGRKVERENHYISVQPLFSLPAEKR